MNGGTFLAFLLTVLMVVVIVIHREPATFPGRAETAQPVVVPAVAATPTVADRTTPPTKPAAGTAPHVEATLLASSPPTPSASAPPTPPSDSTGSGTLKTHGIGCAVAGTAGTGLAMAVGPAEVLAVIGSALLIPVSPILIGAALGTVFVTGCAVGVVVSPMVAG